MIKDLLVSFKDNFKEKSTNPFLGTYIIVWLIRNWDLVYSLFNFDKSYSLAKKIEFIQKYYTTNNFLEGVVSNILWAFGVLIATYTLINISRLIINLYEKQLTPLILKYTDSDSIVEKSSFDKLKKHRDYIQNRLEQERESKSSLELQINSLEDEIKNLKGKPIQNENKYANASSTFKDKTKLMYNKIVDKDWENDFIETSILIDESDDDLVDNNKINDPFEFFISLGLIDTFGKNKNTTEVAFSELGEAVLEKVREYL